MAITIEDLERLVSEAKADDDARRERLVTLIGLYARLIALREPKRFKARATEYCDEPGTGNGSSPPDKSYRNRTGPRLMLLLETQTEDVPDTGSFYHSWHRVTQDPGLYVDAGGDLWGSEESGTGSFSQFPARPGDCNVHVRVDWSRRTASDLTTADLEAAEAKLRNIAATVLK
ncbi:MAG TPA: hypothetical protein VFQ61_06445 [Polyangiaceae bacterium]|nr:hypothetical protein [Polyangiaceae bacterium]